MSSEGVEQITRVFGLTYGPDTWPNREMLADYHQDLVYHPRSDEPDPAPKIGRGAYERLIDSFCEAFAEITFDIVEVIDADDHVIASTVLNGRGSASGANVKEPYVFVYRYRDGLVVEGWEYKTVAEALTARGIEVGARQAELSFDRGRT